MSIDNDRMALDACSYEDIFNIVIFWPKSYRQPDLIEQAIKIIKDKISVKYEKKLELNALGLHNLINQINSLRGGGRNNGVDFNNIWVPDGFCIFLLIQASTEIIHRLKIEELNNYCHNFLYITENSRQTRLIANAVFNPNSIYFLNHASPGRYKQSLAVLDSFVKLIEDNHRDKNDYIVDSSMVLAIYGIRPAADLDYYTLESRELDRIKAERIEEHDELQKSYYNGNIKDLITKPENYFMYRELKFVTLEQLLAFKRRRYEERHDIKDKCDVLLINMMLENRTNIFIRMILLATIFFQRKKQFIKESIHKMIFK